MAEQIFQCRQMRIDLLVIPDLTTLYGYIEIDPDQNGLARDVLCLFYGSYFHRKD